jgi:hypothetical protein
MIFCNNTDNQDTQFQYMAFNVFDVLMYVGRKVQI